MMQILRSNTNAIDNVIPEHGQLACRMDLPKVLKIGNGKDLFKDLDCVGNVRLEKIVDISSHEIGFREGYDDAWTNGYISYVPGTKLVLHYYDKNLSAPVYSVCLSDTGYYCIHVSESSANIVLPTNDETWKWFKAALLAKRFYQVSSGDMSGRLCEVHEFSQGTLTFTDCQSYDTFMNSDISGQMSEHCPYYYTP